MEEAGVERSRKKRRAPEDEKASSDSGRDGEESKHLRALQERISQLEAELSAERAEKNAERAEMNAERAKNAAALDKLTKAEKEVNELKEQLTENGIMRRIRCPLQWGVAKIAPLADLGSSRCRILCATSEVVAVVIHGIDKIFFIPSKRTSLPGGLVGVPVLDLIKSEWEDDLPFTCCFSMDGHSFIIRHRERHPFAATVIHSDDGHFTAGAVRVLNYSHDGGRFLPELLFLGQDGEIYEVREFNEIWHLNFDNENQILNYWPPNSLDQDLEEMDGSTQFVRGGRLAVARSYDDNGNRAVPGLLFQVDGNFRRQQKLPPINPCSVGIEFVKAVPGPVDSVRCIVVTEDGDRLIWDEICDDSFKEYRFRLPCGQKGIVVEQEPSDKCYFIYKGKLYAGTIQPDFHSLVSLCRARCLSLASDELKRAHPGLELYSNENFIKAFHGDPLQEEVPVLTLHR